MSHFEKERLGNCGEPSQVDDPRNPHCENIDKEQLELALLTSPVPHDNPVSSESEVLEPGYCAEHDREFVGDSCGGGR